MIELEIDGKKIEAQPGAMIIQAADEHGIYIPRFCYHKKLSIAANCRMCLVEVEKAPKTLPACATPVMPGMKVFTQSEKSLQSQRAVMEFLLINHPLDCPICDQGGECELQDLSMGYGRGVSRYAQGKRSVKDKNLGPLIASEMTRCIQCTRCVRFGNEVAGMPELGATGRGELLEITTYVESAIKSELSGNMIDVCPVGALTNKPYRFTARAWEMRQHAGIAAHDCLGSNIFLHTRSEEYSPQRHVMRVVPRENEAINESWLSDRDRYSYEAINSPERLLQPRIKRDGVWESVSWEIALQEIKTRLETVIRENGAQALGVLASPNTTVEEGYLLQKLFRKLGTANIDYRIRQTDFRVADTEPSLGMAIADLEKLNTLLLIGSDLRQEQPLANHRVRKAVLRNRAKVLRVNPIDYPQNYPLAAQKIVGGGEFVLTLAKILKSLQTKQNAQLPPELTEFLAAVEPGEIETTIAEQLIPGSADGSSTKSAVLLGAYAINHNDAAIIHLLARQIAELANATFGILSEGANALGLSLTGVLPRATAINQPAGLDAKAMLLQMLRAYVLLNIDPAQDLAYPAAASAALEKADFVLALSAFQSPALEKSAHIILPIATFAETAGSYVNTESRWQSMSAATLPAGDALPVWQALSDLAKVLAIEDCVYQAIAEIHEEARGLLEIESIAKKPSQSLSVDDLQNSIRQEKLTRLGSWPMYCMDMLLRHAEALQATLDKELAMIAVNSETARSLQLEPGALLTAVQGESRIRLPLLIDDRVAVGQVVIYSGLTETAGFGEAIGKVELIPPSPLVGEGAEGG